MWPALSKDACGRASCSCRFLLRLVVRITCTIAAPRLGKTPPHMTRMTRMGLHMAIAGAMATACSSPLLWSVLVAFTIIKTRPGWGDLSGSWWASCKKGRWGVWGLVSHGFSRPGAAPALRPRLRLAGRVSASQGSASARRAPPPPVLHQARIPPTPHTPTVAACVGRCSSQRVVQLTYKSIE